MSRTLMLAAFSHHRDDLQETYPTRKTLRLTPELAGRAALFAGDQHLPAISMCQRSAERLDQGLVQAGEGAEKPPAFPLEPGHHGLMLARPALPGVEPPRLEDLDVVSAGDRGRHLVAEIGVLGPLDAALDDALHDRGGAGNRYLLGTGVVVAAADAPGVQHERLDLVAAKQLEHPVAHVGHVAREERVGAGDAQELALLVLAAGRGAGG